MLDQLARKSMRTNLKDKTFCELFSDVIEDWEAVLVLISLVLDVMQ